MADRNTPQLETERLILRKFTENDIEALYLILRDKEVNTFLPWFPLQSMEEAKAFLMQGMRQSMKSPRPTPMPSA